MKKYKYQPRLNPLYCINFYADENNILCLEETCNLTKDSLGDYNPQYKTLWREPEQQLKALARDLAWSELLDKKDKKLLKIFFKEYIDTLNE